MEKQILYDSAKVSKKGKVQRPATSHEGPGVVLFLEVFYNGCYVKKLFPQIRHNGKQDTFPEKYNEVETNTIPALGFRIIAVSRSTGPNCVHRRAKCRVRGKTLAAL